MLENPASAAKWSNCSSVNSGKIAETNPILIAAPRRSFGKSVESSASATGNIGPGALARASGDRLAEQDFAMTVVERREARGAVRTSIDPAVDGQGELLAGVWKAL